VTLYVPPHFAGDAAAARRLIADHPFATLVTAAASGIVVTHLPLLLEDDGGSLLGHVAAPNPHARVLADADSVAIFHGPHAFVSRGWYASPADNVPTWNFAAVHVTGRARLLDAAGRRRAVERLSARFEPPALPPITAAHFERLLGGIVAFSLPLSRVEAKFKMSQNKAEADRAGVIAGLRAAGGEQEKAVADWMARREPPCP
jgi:transcriptional regulator